MARTPSKECPTLVDYESDAEGGDSGTETVVGYQTELLAPAAGAQFMKEHLNFGAKSFFSYVISNGGPLSKNYLTSLYRQALEQLAVEERHSKIARQMLNTKQFKKNVHCAWSKVLLPGRPLNTGINIQNSRFNSRETIIGKSMRISRGRSRSPESSTKRVKMTDEIVGGMSPACPASPGITPCLKAKFHDAVIIIRQTDPNSRIGKGRRTVTMSPMRQEVFVNAIILLVLPAFVAHFRNIHEKVPEITLKKVCRKEPPVPFPPDFNSK